MTPFKLEGLTAPRSFIRASDQITDADGLYKIDFDIIRIRPGFNPRQKPDSLSEELWEQTLMISDLANGIYENNGPIDPLLGDIYKEDGCFYITEGERRFRAIRLLLATDRHVYPNGQFVNQVKVILNAKDMTDLERKKIALRSADKMKLTVMQRARYYLKFKVDDKLSHEALAHELKVSRQTVDNYILAATEFSPDLQQKLDDEAINITAALHEHREAKKKKNGGTDPDESDFLTTEFEDKEVIKNKLVGDDDLEQKPDNSVTFPGSMGGPKEESSGAHTVGTDSIYMQDRKKAAWTQFVHRYEVIKDELQKSKPGYFLNGKWIDEMVVRLGNEYNLTVK